jgi:hypothetical protein
MIRKICAGASLAGLLTLGAGTAVRTANAQDPADKQEQQASKTISGKVSAIGNGGHSFSLEVGENKNTMNFVVDKNTQVNGQVREGTAVTVQYQAMANGQTLAVSITAQA